jgi:ABC-type sugar transport system ATPase subunit
MSAAGRVVLRGVTKRHGTFPALHGIDLEITPGEFFALLGPSGSGKTTTLRIIAGLDQPNEGSVIVDGKDVTDAEPGDRDVAMVFQSYALYPHMSVYQNIAFPLRMVGMPKPQIHSAVQEAAATVRIAHLLDRKPGQLSGGQQQRCALARAIVRKPRLFLLDEPLSNLDAKLRLETRGELKRLQRSLGITAVYVTHDQEEAMSIADRLAVFMEGRLAQIGTPDAVYARPGSVEVASFLGSPPMNLLDAQLAGNELRIADRIWSVAIATRQSGPVVAGIRPSALRFAETGIAGRLDLIEQLGDTTIITVMVGNSSLRVRASSRPPLPEGADVRVDCDAADIHLFNEASGHRLG